jgi:hypothetical protein
LIRAALKTCHGRVFFLMAGPGKHFSWPGQKKFDLSITSTTFSYGQATRNLPQNKHLAKDYQHRGSNPGRSSGFTLLYHCPSSTSMVNPPLAEATYSTVKPPYLSA